VSSPESGPAFLARLKFYRLVGTLVKEQGPDYALDLLMRIQDELIARVPEPPTDGENER
jgi:hypothetical protein